MKDVLNESIKSFDVFSSFFGLLKLVLVILELGRREIVGCRRLFLVYVVYYVEGNYVLRFRKWCVFFFLFFNFSDGRG